MVLWFNILQTTWNIAATVCMWCVGMVMVMWLPFTGLAIVAWLTGMDSLLTVAISLRVVQIVVFALMLVSGLLCALVVGCLLATQALFGVKE